jgi:hypothetical protein
VDFEFNPIELDRVLSRAQHSWLAWKLRDRSLDEADTDAHPLAAYRSVAGLDSFRRVSELRASDPLREPLRRWVYRLAEQRVDQVTANALARERAKPHRPSDAPGREAVSFDQMLTRALGDAPRRENWSRLSLQYAPPVSARCVELWQRRREVARRMGLAQPGEIEAPLEDTAQIADSLAKVTRERVGELGLGSLSAFFERAIGADVPGSWPARLTPPRMLDYFRDTELLRSLDLRVAPLPGSFGAASFCRALGLLGAAWFEALAPSDQPFVVAHDPYGLGRHGAAALFRLLPLNARFAQRYLDLSPHALPDMQRRLAQLWLLDLAGAALRVRWRKPALTSERAFREAFAELAHADLGLSLPPDIAGALLSLGVEDEQALVGRLEAVTRAEELVEAHDEDWFRNPRAIEQLRAEARLPPTPRADPERTQRSLALVTKRLEQLLR